MALITFFLLLKEVFCLTYSMYPATNPPPARRKGCTMQAIPDKNMTVFFGGYDTHENIYGDLWSYKFDVDQWEQIFSSDGNDPVPRYNAASFYIEASTQFCIWGGNTNRGQLNDLWCFSLKFLSWTKKAQEGTDLPSPKYNMGYTSWKDSGFSLAASNNVKFAIFGGVETSDYSNDLFILDTNTWTWTLSSYEGETKPESQDFPVIFYYNNSIYLIYGLTWDNEDYDYYQVKFYKYNLTSSEWEDITNKNDPYTFRQYAQGVVVGDTFYYFFGVSSDWSDYPNICEKVDLTDPTYPWSEVKIRGDNDEYLGRETFGIATINEAIHIFGGTQWSIQVNSFVSIKYETDPMTYNYDENYISPGARIDHSLNYVGGYLLLFGGEFNGDYSMDLWQLDITTFIWKYLNPGGDIPPARSNHGSASRGDVLIIWGGEGSEGYLNDAYIYNILTNTWQLLDNSGSAAPSPRIGACVGIDFSRILIYGGLDRDGVKDELWLFDLGTHIYSLLDSNIDDGPEPLYKASCDYESDGEGKFYVMLGIDKYEYPLNGMFYYDLAKDKWITIYNNNTNVQWSRGNAQAFKVKDRYLIFGGEDIWQPSLDVFYYNATSKQFTKLTDLFTYVWSAAAEYIGSTVIIYGGAADTGMTVRRSIPSTNQFGMDLLSDCSSSAECYWQCSPGTYKSGKTCYLCPPGTYQPIYGGTCQSCKRGTYYQYYGATSASQCYPCSEGTFNNKTGASYCLVCPYGSSCPAGSTAPSWFDTDKYDSSIQPDLLDSGESEASSNAAIVYSTVGSVGALILIIVLIFYERMTFLVKIDAYTDKHEKKLNMPVILKKTKVGGYFTILFFVLCIMIVVNTIINYVVNNEMEVKALVPLIVMDETVSKYTADMVVNVEVKNYGGMCIDQNGDCDNSISYAIINMHGTSIDMSCSANTTNNDCILYIRCHDCQVENGAYIFYSFLSSESYSTGFTVNVTSFSSIPDKSSSYQASVYSSDEKVFRGATASIYNFDTVPSYFKDSNGDNNTGYHLALYESPTPGSQFKTNELAVSYDLYLRLNFNKNSNCLYTKRSLKQTWLQLISALLGSIFGLLGAIGGAMAFVEGNIDAQASKADSQMKADKIADEEERLEMMIRGFTEDGEKKGYFNDYISSDNSHRNMPD
ncbi:unnamed protein product [Blepharisma stoltei]|uniref:Tyrosine-protein kinase ephrin type A/B receptor-like domain-containing protein n=1 Tax=Blepharisma stoltei TaxID=1481888 RepID=A0AAU9JT57_9CILI|nr:unnamed protein product [Blepharisma stoltei]